MGELHVRGFKIEIQFQFALLINILHIYCNLHYLTVCNYRLRGTYIMYYAHKHLAKKGNTFNI